MRPNREDAATKNRKRWTLLWAQRCICPACDRLLDPRVAPSSRVYPVIDHVIPLSRGGVHAIRNRLVKHRRCDAAKADDWRISDADRAMQAVVAEALEQMHPQLWTWRDCKNAVLSALKAGDPMAEAA